MKLYQKLNLALEMCNFPPLKNISAYRKIGAGAWHDAYLVYPGQAERLVIRLRKKIIYGRPDIFDEKELHEDYGPVGLYYRQANGCWPGLCPQIYEYRLDSELSFTIESYMGPALALGRLTPATAYAYGQQVGAFFRTMHAQPPPLKGFGNLVWTGTALAGEDQTSPKSIWQAERDAIFEQFEQLERSRFKFDVIRVKPTLEAALGQRRFDQEPVVLANGDITPENLISRRDKFAGLIDPVPVLHNGLRYASFFIYCYKSYLPNLHDAPRYARHQFERYLPVMTALADGYMAGYTQNDERVAQALQLEYFLWAIDAAYEQWQRLNAVPTPELHLRAGDKKMMAARLRRFLRELGTFTTE